MSRTSTRPITSSKLTRFIFQSFLFIKSPQLSIEINQGRIGYAGTHVPMSVPRLGLIKPGQTHVCPKLWAFSITITLWLILHLFQNRRLVCPKLRAFAELFCLLSLSVGFFNRPGRTYLATLQCSSWLLEDQICILAFSTELQPSG